MPAIAGPAVGMLYAAAAACAATGPAGGPATQAAPLERPNVVFILTDDQRWDAMSCAEHPFLRTPNLDRLAAEGVRFAEAFVTCSLCSPSRASFLSGLYPHAHGVRDNFTDYPADLPSFPRQLQGIGYETAWIGKWHMGEQDDAPRPGFDHWASHRGQGDYFDTMFNIDGRREVVRGYYTRVITDMATRWIRRPRSRPFCLIIGHKAPHTPFVPEERYARAFDGIPIAYPESAFHLEGKPDWVIQRLTTWHGIYGPLFGFRREFPDTRPEGAEAFAAFVRAYTATILSVDDSVGQVRRALEETGLLDRTVIIFASDNGMLLGEHGMTDKRTMHEPSIRIPLLMRYPPAVRAGMVIRRMVLNIDLAPTILELCGAPPLPRTHGASFRRLLEDPQADWRRSWYYAYDYERQFPYTPNVRGVRTERWKFIRYPHGDGGPDRHRPELYDLIEDPGERHNRADDPACAEIRAGMEAELDRLMDQAGALPDRMPLDEGVKPVLPDAAIR